MTPTIFFFISEQLAKYKVSIPLSVGINFSAMRRIIYYLQKLTFKKR